MPETIRSASAYLRQLFAADDAIVLTLIHKASAEVIQRTDFAHSFAATKYQGWLRYQNSKHFEIYASVNTVRPRSYGRRKKNILAIRHLFLDFDEDGKARVAHLLERNDLPHPNYVLNTSPDKYQVLWRVRDFTPESAERLLRSLSRSTGADIAVTDIARVLRVPGFYNHKYTPPAFVTALKYHSDVFAPADFPSPAPSEPIPPPNDYLFAGGDHFAGDISRSGMDWRETLRRLRRGDSPETIIDDLIRLRRDKPDPRYYAELTVSRARALIAQTPSRSRRRPQCHSFRSSGE